MGVLSNKIHRDLLKPGDHIYSWRHGFLYAHHGIYDGEGNVIHFTQGAGRFLLSSSPSHSSDNASHTSSNLHGIYVGEGKVIHFTRGAGRFLLSSSPSHSSGKPCPNCGDQSALDGVISSCIDCFLSGGDLYRFEYGVNPAFFIAQARGGTCTLVRADPPEDVLHRASVLLEKGFASYHVFKNNCEDFAIYCKTGYVVFTTGRSGQAASFVAAATAVVSLPLRISTTGFTDLGVGGYGMVVLGCGMYCISRFVSDIRMRPDVMKVPVERLITPCALGEQVVATEVRKKE